MSEHPERYELMGEVIRSRLLYSTESQAELARRLDVSPNKLRQMREGEPGQYRNDTLAKVSDGLWGDPGVLRRVLDGEEFQVMPPPLESLRDRTARLNERRQGILGSVERGHDHRTIDDIVAEVNRIDDETSEVRERIISAAVALAEDPTTDAETLRLADLLFYRLVAAPEEGHRRLAGLPTRTEELSEGAIDPADASGRRRHIFQPQDDREWREEKGRAATLGADTTTTNPPAVPEGSDRPSPDPEPEGP